MAVFSNRVAQLEAQNQELKNEIQRLLAKPAAVKPGILSLSRRNGGAAWQFRYGVKKRVDPKKQAPQAVKLPNPQVSLQIVSDDICKQLKGGPRPVT